MGCINSKVKILPVEIILTSFDLDTQESRPVKEFPFYSQRLKAVDYQAIIAKGDNWTDPTFPPEKSSILDATMMRQKRHEEWENFVWKRPEEVYGEDGFVVCNKIGPNDVKQGKCGDCYFLSSISSLAEKENRVERIFVTKEVNKAGCYAVQLYLNGELKIVVVDDYFPYDTFKEEWAMSKPSEDSNEIWVLIIEKAWAKVFGSY